MKILVVDDETDVEMLFSQRFRKEIRNEEVRINFAFNGEDALKYLRSLDPFDVVLVLSDINMPGMTGLQLLKIIKTEFRDLRVMMVTAYGDDNNYQTAKQIGADDFITKPVDFNLLREKIRQLT
ncbi:MAG: response regulator [Bacteroidia bacterium]|nr:response regulator [Bacteroidia bacterium]